MNSFCRFWERICLLPPSQLLRSSWWSSVFFIFKGITPRLPPSSVFIRPSCCTSLLPHSFQKNIYLSGALGLVVAHEIHHHCVMQELLPWLAASLTVAVELSWSLNAGSYFPDQRLNPHPLPLQGGFLTAEPARKSLPFFLVGLLSLYLRLTLSQVRSLFYESSVNYICKDPLVK